MTRVIQGLVLLVGLIAFVWGGALMVLGFAGESATPRHVQVRRTGGERDEATPNRYTYSIGYEFVTRDGAVVSGQAQAIGNSVSVTTPRRIRYLAALPRVNAPEDHCGFAVYPLALLGIGALLFWSILGRRRKKTPTRSRPASTRRKAGAPAEAPASRVDPEAARAWLRRYRINSRRYAWGFVAVVVVGIGTLIRIELEVFDRDWFLATGFAALVTWILAMGSRRAAESSWDGVVSSREIREVGDARGSGTATAQVRHIIHVRTDRGKHRKIRVGAALFDAYPEGAAVRKIAGLSFPLSDAVDATTAFCPVCGNLLRGATGTCPSCRAPVFDFADLT